MFKDDNKDIMTFSGAYTDNSEHISQSCHIITMVQRFLCPKSIASLLFWTLKANKPTSQQDLK